MRGLITLTMLCVLVATAGRAAAQTPLGASTGAAVEGVAGNKVLQLRYLSSSPFTGISGNLDFGALLTENREFMLSTAMLFDTNLPVPRLRLQVGPELSLAWLNASQKTDVAALAFGAAARYELIERLGLSAFGSAYYSPGVTTFGSAHNMYDFTAGAQIRVADRLYVLGGYRWLKFTLVGQPDEKVSNEVFGGIRWQLQ